MLRYTASKVEKQIMLGDDVLGDDVLFRFFVIKHPASSTKLRIDGRRNNGR